MATKKKPRRITQEELAGMHYDPVEKVYYDTSELEERGMEVPEWARGGGDKTSKDFSPTHELSESGRIVPIGGEPDSYDPAVARGGGEFYAPPEGEPVWQEKDADGNVTYTEYAPGSEARKVRFESRAELKQELERRRVQGEFPRGRGGLYGLIPYADYEKQREEELARERADRLEAKVEKLGPVAAREDVETTTEKAPSTPVPDKPVKDDGASAAADDEGITEQERAERSGFPKGHPSGKEPKTEYKPEPESPTTKKAKSRPPEDKPESTQLAVGDVVEERDFDPLDKELTAEEREKIEAGLAELDDKVGPLEDAMQAVEEEPDTITVGEKGESREGESRERGDEITLTELNPSQEIPESPDDPELTDVELAVEPPEPPMEAAAEDTPAAGEIPPLPEAEEDGLTAEEIAVLAAKEFPDNGMEYLEPIFEASVFKHKYNANDPRDRAQMEFLINFFIREGLPLTPTIEAGLGKKAADEFYGAEEAK